MLVGLEGVSDMVMRCGVLRHQGIMTLSLNLNLEFTFPTILVDLLVHLPTSQPLIGRTTDVCEIGQLFMKGLLNQHQ